MRSLNRSNQCEHHRGIVIDDPRNSLSHTDPHRESFQLCSHVDSRYQQLRPTLVRVTFLGRLELCLMADKECSKSSSDGTPIVWWKTSTLIRRMTSPGMSRYSPVGPSVDRE